MRKLQLNDKLTTYLEKVALYLKENFIGDKIDQKQLRYLSQTIQLEEKTNPYLIRSTMTLISVFMILFLLWSIVTNVNEVVRSAGVTVPNGQINKVQHSIGGPIKKILVKEGETVNKNQPLIILDDTSVKHEIASLKAKKTNLLIKKERLLSLIENREPNFSHIKFRNEGELEKQQIFLNKTKLGFEKEIEIVEKQIKQKNLRIKILNGQLETLSNKKTYTLDLYKTQKKLLEKGLVSKISYINSQKELNDIIGLINKTKDEVLSHKEARDELIDKKGIIESNFIESAYRESEQVDLQMDQINEKILDLKSKKQSYVLRSKHHGVVKGVSLYTAGEVLKPGETALEVVPLTKNLYVELSISPDDIGHLSKGQKVHIKFNTYDFSRYGFVETKVDYISANTFKDTRGQSYYKATAKLPKDHLGRNPASNKIISGMTVQASIITGEKSVLSYLLKPIHRSIESALTER